MIDTTLLITANSNILAVQRLIPKDTPVYWELEHARSCIMQARKMIIQEGKYGHIKADS